MGKRREETRGKQQLQIDGLARHCPEHDVKLLSWSFLVDSLVSTFTALHNYEDFVNPEN